MYSNNTIQQFSFHEESAFGNSTFQLIDKSSTKRDNGFITLIDSSTYDIVSAQPQKHSNQSDGYAYNFMEQNTSNKHQLNFDEESFDQIPYCPNNFISEYNTQISNDASRVPLAERYIAKQKESISAVKEASAVNQSLHSVSNYATEYCEDTQNYARTATKKVVNLRDIVNSNEYVPLSANYNANDFTQSASKVYFGEGIDSANLANCIATNSENDYYYLQHTQEAGNQVDYNKVMVLLNDTSTNKVDPLQLENVESLPYRNKTVNLVFSDTFRAQQMHQADIIQNSTSPIMLNQSMLDLQTVQIISQSGNQLSNFENNTLEQNHLLSVDTDNKDVLIKRKAVTFENGKVFDYSDLEIFIKDELEHKTKRKRLIQCANCSSNVWVMDFKQHRCVQGLTLKPLHVSDLTIDNIITNLKVGAPAAFRLLRENQIRVRRFLKDELKFDINCYGTNHSDMGSRFNSKKYGPHECNLCERKFVHASGLLRHMEKHELDLIPTTTTLTKQSSRIEVNPKINALHAVIKCILCGRIFFETYHAMQHLLSSHFIGIKSENYETTFCANLPFEHYIDKCMNFMRANDTLRGFEGTAENEWCDENPRLFLKMVILSCVLQCEFCDFFFTDVSSLFVHSGFHRPSRPFECFQCEIYVKTSKDISLHWQGDCVYTREHLKEVMKSISRFYVCNICGNKFQNLEQLHDHRHAAYHYFPRFNGNKNLQISCEQCGDLFDEAQQAAVHYEQKHSRRYKRDKEPEKQEKSRQFLCDICGKSYTQSSHLWQHLRFHQGVKPFACAEPGCLRRFTIRPDLNDHIRKCHTGERPYHCAECGKRFLTGSVFYQHRLIHRGERRYECDECGKRFYRADALKNHQRIHTGEKPYSCLFCTKTFRQRGDRDKHIRARHAHLNQRSRLMMQMQKLQLETKAAALQAVGANNLGNQEYTQVASEGTLLPTHQLTEIVNSTVQNFLPPPLYELTQD